METLQPTPTTLKDEWGHDLGNPIAVLKAEPEELLRDRGIAFTEGHDDLDSVRIALLRAASGVEYALLRHENAPQPGTEVVARTTNAQPKRFAADLQELLRYLKLSKAALVWVAPAVEPSWKALAPGSRVADRMPAKRPLTRRATSRRVLGTRRTPKSSRKVLKKQA